jgi:hypothetical protein
MLVERITDAGDFDLVDPHAHDIGPGRNGR